MTDIKLIVGFCESNKITNYKINDDGSIDVNGNVEFSLKYHSKIPIKFNKVTGYFIISYSKYTKLQSLENSPREVGRYFNCSNLQLQSLKGSPDYIGEHFLCYNNNLTTLNYYPKFVGGKFECVNNPLESLDGYTGDYNKLLCDNKEKLIRKNKLKHINL